MEKMSLILIAIPVILIILFGVYMLTLRRVVPTNMVHIVQRGKNTVSYGVGKSSNTYYKFPSWMPLIGVLVRELPVSNFDIDLLKYSAYDKDRVPFYVDVKAFFHISDTNKAAEKVASFEELKKQLENVVQGAVRSILAGSKLEGIMEDRTIFGDQFTKSVQDDLSNWGVAPIKNIELMDVRDADGSTVIKQIMEKRISAIDMESRIEVAKNKKLAEQSELQARKEVSITKAETERLSGEAQATSTQAINIAKAESTKKSGIAEQQSLAEIAKSSKETAEQNMEVIKVNSIKQAEIDKDKSIIESEAASQNRIIAAEANSKTIEIDALAAFTKSKINVEADKFRVETNAEAKLAENKLSAEGIKQIGTAEANVIAAKGSADAEAKKLMELAGVTAQTTLAQEIGNNVGYQEYLIEIKKVEISQVVGVANAEALAKSELKILVNSGDIQSGVSSLSDILSSKGGTQLNSFLEAFKQTKEGKSLLALLPGLTTEPTNSAE